MNVVMIFADGFEDVEAIATRDVLIRAGINVVDVTINDSDTVTASHKILLKGLKRLSKVNFDDFSAIILPGGSRGVDNLLKDDRVIELVKRFYKKDKYVCAICAAPMVLGKARLLKDKRFTCYPGCEEGIDGIYTGEEVVVTNKIVTARSMLYSVPFGLKIIELLLSKEVSDKVYSGTAGLTKK